MLLACDFLFFYTRLHKTLIMCMFLYGVILCKMLRLGIK